MTDPQESARLMAEFGKTYTRRIFSEMGWAGTTPARRVCSWPCNAPGHEDERDRRPAGVTPRNVTKLVDGLEEEGLLIREPHPHDRRVTSLRLTDKGRQVTRESMGANFATAVRLYEQLSAAERRQPAILQKLLDALRATDAEGDGSAPVLKGDSRSFRYQLLADSE